jgi:hypothetical protein
VKSDMVEAQTKMKDNVEVKGVSVEEHCRDLKRSEESKEG